MFKSQNLLKMGRGKLHSGFEIIHIVAYNDIGTCISDIADKTKRPKIVLFHFLSNPIIYCTVKYTGNPKIRSKRSESLIVRTVASKRMRAKKIESYIKTTSTI